MEKRREWGSDVSFFGPRHMFRESKVIKAVRKYIKSGIVFEAGYGSGSLLFSMVNLGLNVRGIDSSKKFFKYVSSEIKNRNLSKKALVKTGDITKIKFPDNSFDAIVCTEVLEHVKNDEKAVKEFNRVLKKGGICIITVPLGKSNWTLTDEWAGHCRRYETKEITGLLEKNKFQIIKTITFSNHIIKLYHKLAYMPMVKRKINEKVKKEGMAKTKKLSKLKNLAYLVASKVLLLDDLFKSRNPSNILIVAKKT